MKDDVSIRRADISELDLLLCWRMEVLHAVFGLPETDFFSGAVCVSGSLWYRASAILPCATHSGGRPTGSTSLWETGRASP